MKKLVLSVLLVALVIPVGILILYRTAPKVSSEVLVVQGTPEAPAASVEVRESEPVTNVVVVVETDPAKAERDRLFAQLGYNPGGKGHSFRVVYTNSSSAGIRK